MSEAKHTAGQTRECWNCDGTNITGPHQNSSVIRGVKKTWITYRCEDCGCDGEENEFVALSKAGGRS